MHAALNRRRVLQAGAALAAPAIVGAAEPVTLRFLWWGGGDRHKRTLAAIAAFEARHPGVRIKAEYMGSVGYLEKLTMQMVGGTEPDLMQINWAWLNMFSRTGTGFLDLNTQSTELALDQFADEDRRICTIAGKLNGLPMSYTARLFLWNTASFARAGIPVPSTWDELFAAGEVFRRTLGERAYPIDGEIYDMLLLAQAYVFQLHGTPYVHPTEPRVAMSPAAVLDWVKTYKRLFASRAATPVPYRASLGGAEKPLEQQPDWVVGRWGGTYTWDTVVRSRLSTLDAQQTLDVGPFLTLPGAKNSGMFGRPTALFAISKRTKHPALAAKFLNFLLTDAEAARILGLTRGVPSSRIAYRALEEAKLLPALELKAYRQIAEQRAAGRIDLPAMRFEDARFRRFLLEIFELLGYDRIGEADAARRLVDDGNALLARIK
ncbi:ABC transporter substrate-binding protein [Aquabacterium humicola]|uniref:ABC transporter substrate-binding protein n=1 Tax=Aquabacterium humicola TaxID=3237377 RepID=UPI002543793F|nr:extracellular solute-binding protein [Rubrivivax pictus]